MTIARATLLGTVCVAVFGMTAVPSAQFTGGQGGGFNQPGGTNQPGGINQPGGGTNQPRTNTGDPTNGGINQPGTNQPGTYPRTNGTGEEGYVPGGTGGFNNPNATGRGARGTAPTAPGRGGSSININQASYSFPGTGQEVDFSWFASTKVNKKKKAPLVIALHGANTTPSMMIRFLGVAAEKGGYIVAAPMGEGLQSWFGASGTYETREFSEKDVMNIITIMKKTFTVDEQRIYLVGHSMGGAGAVHLGVKFKNVWAAVAAAAPALPLDPVMLEDARSLPIIFVLGETDEMMPPDRAQPWGDKMKALNMDHEYDVIKGGHGEAITMGADYIFKFFEKHTKPAAN